MHTSGNELHLSIVWVVGLHDLQHVRDHLPSAALQSQKRISTELCI